MTAHDSSDGENNVLARLGRIEVTLGDLARAARSGRDRRLLRAILVERVIRERAEEAGISVDDQALQREADAFRQRNKLFKAAETRAWLSAQGLDQDGFERMLELALLRRKLIALVPEQEIEQAFLNQRGRLDRARISRLLVADRALAEELLLQIEEEGADFRSLAMRYSQEPEARDAAGYAGWVSREALDGDVAVAVFAARDGAILGPFTVPGGALLVKVWELAPARLEPPIAAAIAERLFEDSLARRLDGIEIV